MTEIFETSEVRVILNGETIAEVEELTIERLKKIAREHGIKKFTVSAAGEDLTADDFPLYEGEVIIRPYYEAK